MKKKRERDEIGYYKKRKKKKKSQVTAISTQMECGVQEKRVEKNR